MHYTQPITTLIKDRFSCRLYDPTPLTGEMVNSIESCIAELRYRSAGEQSTVRTGGGAIR